MSIREKTVVEQKAPPPHSCAGIAFRHGKILLVKRAKAPFKGCWTCPGGKGLPDEQPVDTMLREFLEEMGIPFEVDSLYEIQRSPEQDYFKFIGRCTGNIRIEPAELLDFGWFSYQEASGLELGFNFQDLVERLHRDRLLL